VARLFVDGGVMVLTAFISPFRSDRAAARALLEPGEFVEIFVDTPLAECERRDPKGLYRRARAGEIHHFTGIDSPYEPPLHPEIHLDTAVLDVAQCVELIIDHLAARGYLSQL
jgi:adenylylsulfate kinase